MSSTGAAVASKKVETLGISFATLHRWVSEFLTFLGLSIMSAWKALNCTASCVSFRIFFFGAWNGQNLLYLTLPSFGFVVACTHKRTSVRHEPQKPTLRRPNKSLIWPNTSDPPSTPNIWIDIEFFMAFEFPQKWFHWKVQLNHVHSVVVSKLFDLVKASRIAVEWQQFVQVCGSEALPQRSLTWTGTWAKELSNYVRESGGTTHISEKNLTCILYERI